MEKSLLKHRSEIKSNFLPLPIDLILISKTWQVSNNILLSYLEMNLSPPPSDSPSSPDINIRVSRNSNSHSLFFPPLVMGFQVTSFQKACKNVVSHEFLLVSQVSFSAWLKQDQAKAKHFPHL